MLRPIQDFFRKLIEPDLLSAPQNREHALQLATAALLVEMMRMDNTVQSAERAAALNALRAEFGLDEAELDSLVALAEQEASEATDYYQFTSLINQACDAAQKLQIVTYLWQVAFADGHLDAHEAHLMRKIGDLLHVSHADYVTAKARGRAAYESHHKN